MWSQVYLDCPICKANGDTPPKIEGVETHVEHIVKDHGVSREKAKKISTEAVTAQLMALAVPRKKGSRYPR